jgi:protein-S-isoprenylcysteine O-methyltransferase Ste14
MNFHLLPVTPVVQTIGVFVCASGIAFSIWAKIHLGKNWGMPMAMKENPDLIVTGPYSFIRHPIYTGMLIAMLGSMVTVGSMWLFWFILFFASFIYSAKKEEKNMLLQFPDEYRDYMKRTKMIIPFIY